MGSLVKENKCFVEGITREEVEAIVQAKINAMGQSGVTGVKGSAETAYRAGNVNITPANIGAMPVSGGGMSGDLQLHNAYPILDRMYSCGNASHIWKDVYSEHFNFPFGKLYNSGESIVIGVFEQLTVRNSSNVDQFMPISASAFNVNSSRRYKKNVRDMSDEEANKVLEVNPVIFDYINEKNGTNVAGAIAEDVYRILPNVVTLKEVNGEMVPDSIDYSKFSMYLLKQVQMLTKRVNELKGGN